MNGKIAGLLKRVAVHRGVHESVVKREWDCTDSRAKGKLRKKLEHEIAQPKTLYL
jgi:hypothetical protein